MLNAHFTRFQHRAAYMLGAHGQLTLFEPEYVVTALF